ncbi:MAG TPA: GNAT family N-acetyltransferase [Micromonosporaceae bacterium]
MTSVRAAHPDDRPAIDEILTASWGEPRAAANGRLYDLTALPSLVAAADDGTIVGVLTYEIDAQDIEVVSIDASRPHQGIGGALLHAAGDIGRSLGLSRLWLVTTNDNLDALRFYQRRGLRIVGVRPGAVRASRRVKPSIPMIGAYGIEIRDEIVLARSLSATVEL